MSNQTNSFDLESLPSHFLNSPQILPALKSSYVIIVNEFLSQGKYSEALNYLQAIESSHYQDQYFSVKLGHLSFKLKKFRESETYYLKALSYGNSQHIDEVWFGLGQVYFAIKSFKQCISAFTSLLVINPNFAYSSLCYLKLGISSIKLKDFGNSLIYLEKSLIKNDLSRELKAEVFCHIGSAQLATGKNMNIERIFSQAAEFIRNFRTGICLAWKLLETDLRKAVLLCDKMCRECDRIEEIADFKCFKAVALMKLNNFDKAREILQLLTRRFPYNLVYGQYLAIVCIKTGFVFEAAQILEYLKMIWPFQLNVLLNYFRVMKKLLRNAEIETVRMQIIGILMIHQYSENEIFRFIDENNSDLKEPMFVLTDFPSSESPDYNILEDHNRII
jgi:tetratricopeptide (TPR) repeat protein